MAMQLSNATYKELSPMLETPLYERDHLQPAIVHLGLGHFHRSHFCYYLHRLLQQGLSNWGIEEVDLLPSTTKEKAEAQDYLYTLCSKDPEGNERACIIGCILGYTEGWKQPGKVVDLIAREETKLVTLTITEKGYCYDSESDGLDWNHPAIVHDLANRTSPQSAVGFLALALSKRKVPLTIASCDNMPSNGRVLYRCMVQYCEQVFPEVLPFLESSVSFPLSMVDRITPNTTDSDALNIVQTYGYEDAWSVVSEDFLQWVLEPKGMEGLPDFSKVGAIITSEVEAYETMKIRLLNGSHSALAYPAYLLGYRYVEQALGDDKIRKFIREQYMKEVGNSVPPLFGFDQEEYKDQLIARFQNPSIKDTILRLAQDGTKKFANALSPALRYALDGGHPFQAMVMALAFWLQFAASVDSALLDDTQRGQLLAAVQNIQTEPQRLFSLIGLSPHYGALLEKPLLASLKRVQEEGPSSVLLHE